MIITTKLTRLLAGTAMTLVLPVGSIPASRGAGAKAAAFFIEGGGRGSWADAGELSPE